MKNKKGFTLIEVLAVVVIMGLLITLIVPNILGDVDTGKSEYNLKLEGQLKLSGKTYYSEHKSDLPTIMNGKSYAYITVPEMKTKNYITNEFVDADGNECSPSYVYVRQKTYNSDEYEYVPCLVCQDKDGKQHTYSESPYCNVSNWNDTTKPTCKNTGTTIDYDDTTLGAWNLKEVHDDTGIMAVIIINKKTGDYRAIDVSEGFSSASTDADKAKLYEEIEGVNIRENFQSYFDTSKVGEYEVKLLDFGGNESDSCLDFEVSTNEFLCKWNSDNLEITSASSKHGFEGLYYKEDKDAEEHKIPLDLTGKKKIETAMNLNLSEYGIPKGSIIYFKDTLDNNIYGECDAEPGIPKCEFTQKPGRDFVGTKGTTIKATCKLCSEEICSNLKVNDDYKTKIVAQKEHGTISNIKVNPSEGEGKTLTFSFKYTPKKDISDVDKIILESGLVVNSSDSTKINYPIETKVYVDTKPPRIILGNIVGDTVTSDSVLKKYKGSGYKGKVSRTVQCIDEPTKMSSGVSTFKVNNAVVTKNPYTKVYSKRGSYTMTSWCKDGAGNETTGPKWSLRLLVQGRHCTICGVETYKSCRAKACDCETYASSCKKCGCNYDTHYYTTCRWCCQGKNGTECSGSTSCSNGSSTEGLHGRICFCSCSQTSETTCSSCKRCKSAGCSVHEFCRTKACGCDTGKSCWW